MPDEITSYETAFSLTERMLENARKDQWEDVMVLEGERQRLFDRIKDSDKKAPTARENPESKERLIKRILAMDAEISDLIEREMAEAQKSFVSEKRLLKAYGVPAQSSP